MIKIKWAASCSSLLCTTEHACARRLSEAWRDAPDCYIIASMVINQQQVQGRGEGEIGQGGFAGELPEG